MMLAAATATAPLWLMTVMTKLTQRSLHCDRELTIVAVTVLEFDVDAGDCVSFFLLLLFIFILVCCLFPVDDAHLATTNVDDEEDGT